jgi:hypothetical protein
MPKLAKEFVMQHIAGPIEISADGTYLPFAFVKGAHLLVFGADSFVIVLHGAWNSFGLIGTEHNGISILCANNSRMVLSTHCRGPAGNGKVTEDQRREFERICGMDLDAFREFINTHPDADSKVLIPKLEPIIRPKLRYRASDFAPTKFSTARDKLVFIKALITFLCNHCDRDLFTRNLYEGLHQHLGHIAHYNRTQFYQEWFTGSGMPFRFLEYHLHNQVFGDWRDVADAFKLWISGPEGKIVHSHYDGLRFDFEADSKRGMT